jgi:hypothetical protein
MNELLSKGWQPVASSECHVHGMPGLVHRPPAMGHTTTLAALSPPPLLARLAIGSKGEPELSRRERAHETPYLDGKGVVEGVVARTRAQGTSRLRAARRPEETSTIVAPILADARRGHRPDPAAPVLQAVLVRELPAAYAGAQLGELRPGDDR